MEKYPIQTGEYNLSWCVDMSNEDIKKFAQEIQAVAIGMQDKLIKFTENNPNHPAIMQGQNKVVTVAKAMEIVLYLVQYKDLYEHLMAQLTQLQEAGVVDLEPI